MGSPNTKVHEKYMDRCLQLALNGKDHVAPNPMVGAVIVYNDKIAGEGYHQEYGKPHAEVNAISSVKDKEILKKSTIYVSLEPCSHYGKTPPCSKLIINAGIPKVVVATPDPYHEVSGRGIEMLKNAGIEVTVGVREKEAQALNKEFFMSQTQFRPYIYLKWAQTKDGFIDKERIPGEAIRPTPISNNLTKILVHKLRASVSGIMIGTNTAINDNPSLTTRLWAGKNPIRIVLDRSCRIPAQYNIYDNSVETLLFTEKHIEERVKGITKFIPLIFDKNVIGSLLTTLNKRKINSILIEGGTSVLQSFISAGAWDEAFIEIADKSFYSGIKAPTISGIILEDNKVETAQTIHLKNKENYKIL